MCQRAKCRQCGKATYVGCGQHVEVVLAGVPAGQRCACPPSTPSGGGLWKRLLGRA
jgi:hypothetical protein